MYSESILKTDLKKFQYNIFGALYSQTLKTFTLLTSEKIIVTSYLDFAPQG
jgi:hypothetical protein